MRHYHVLCGLRGCYMPDDNSVYATRKDAERSAVWLAKNAREEGERVTGSAKSGYYTVGEHNCIEITECDSDCNVEAE